MGESERDVEEMKCTQAISSVGGRERGGGEGDRKACERGIERREV